MFFSFLGIGIFGIYVLSIGKIKYTNRMKKIIFAVFALSLAVLAYNAQPLWDLSQHFAYMEKIQDADISLWKLCTEGVAPYEHNQSYWLFNLLCYIAAKINNFHIVPFVMVLADYLIFSYITLDWQKKRTVPRCVFVFSLLVCFTAMPLVYATAGMRNANAAALSALAVYFYLEKEKPIICPAILMAAAIFMHPSMLLVFPALMLAKRRLTWKMIAAIAAVILMIPMIARIFYSSSITFFNHIGYLYLRFSSSSQYTNSRRYLYVEIILILTYLLLAFMNWKAKKHNRSCLENFFILYLLCILGNIGNYDLVIRPMYVIAPLALPVAHIMFCQKWHIKVRHIIGFKWMLIVALSGFCIWCIWEYTLIFIPYF